jgi:hypothetical protein
MNVTAYLADLPLVRPNLIWHDIGLAVVAVFTNLRRKPPFKFDLSIVEVPGYHDDVLRLLIDAGDISTTQVDRLRRTYEPARLVELAAIAIAGLGLYHAGGRSQRKDFESAWQQKWQRLTETVAGGFYVCVAEFETPTGRLAFQD